MLIWSAIAYLFWSALVVALFLLNLLYFYRHDILHWCRRLTG